MESKKQTGFSLFPQPPTPPARRGRARTRSSSGGSSKFSKIKSSQAVHHGRKASTSLIDSFDQPGLIPAPLQIKKPCEDIPPVPILRPSQPPSTPKKSRKERSPPPKTPESAPPQLPSLPQSSPFAPLSRSFGRSGHLRAKTRVIAEYVELEAGTRKRASSRLSQWLDLEDGEIDQRRLSRYLGSVLDNTFEVPTFESGATPPVPLRRKISKHELNAVGEHCECPPDAIICHCSSSPEFERFRSWSHHKQNSSISSTACLLGVPRARFQLTFFQAPEPSVAELPSPPGLTYDTEDNVSDAEDWSSPRTPSRGDIFNSPASKHKSYSSKQVVMSPSSSSISNQSRFQSFSRPFRPDSTYRLTSTETSGPSTPSKTQSPSKSSKAGFLTSISTMSSFDFDFEFQSRRQSLLQQRSLNLQSLPPLHHDKELSSHLRTGSNETVASQASHSSQYEVSTATATVAMSGSSIKPVIVTKKGRRTKPSASTSTSTSTSTSSKSSTSSFSVPEYWRQYDAGMRARSRSTTMGTTATNDSAALSAMLTMPVLSPKNIIPATTTMAGNAFARRSSSTPTMVQAIEKNGCNSLDAKVTGAGLTENLNRSSAKADLTSTPPAETPTNDHVQAYAKVQARLRAYMSGGQNTVNRNSSVDKIKPKSASEGSHSRSKDCLYVDDNIITRGDSGVFGRMGCVGASFTDQPE